MDPRIIIYSTLLKLLTTTSENFVERTIIIILQELHINCLLNDSFHYLTVSSLTFHLQVQNLVIILIFIKIF